MNIILILWSPYFLLFLKHLQHLQLQSQPQLSSSQFPQQFSVMNKSPPSWPVANMNNNPIIKHKDKGMNNNINPKILKTLQHFPLHLLLFLILGIPEFSSLLLILFVPFWTMFTGKSFVLKFVDKGKLVATELLLLFVFINSAFLIRFFDFISEENFVSSDLGYTVTDLV